MQWYRAEIVGYKKSKRHTGYYYPVFEYEDHYGIARRYIRQKKIEKNPFTSTKRYWICRKNFQVFESSEKRLSPFVYFLALRLLLLIVAFINPKIAFWTIVVNTGCKVSYKAIKLWRKYTLVSIDEDLIKVSGMIVGYRRVKKRTWLDCKEVYLPLVKYKYQGFEYIHIGKIGCEEEQQIPNSICKIFINERRQQVLDEFEINAPLINIQSWSIASLKDTSARIIQRTKKERAIAKEQQRRQRETQQAQQAVGLSPLRVVEYKKAANWY